VPGGENRHGRSRIERRAKEGDNMAWFIAILIISAFAGGAVVENLYAPVARVRKFYQRVRGQ
jgi:hypothetical protein